MSEWNDIENLGTALQNYTKILKCDKCGAEFSNGEEGVSGTNLYFQHFKEEHCEDEEVN